MPRRRLTAEELTQRGSPHAARRRREEAAAARQNAPLAPERKPPPPPGWMKGEASRKWRSVVGLLAKMGILTIADVDVIARYVTAWVRWREAEDTIDKEGLTVASAAGTLKAHPALRVRVDMSNQLRDLGDRLGLNPSARQRLNVAAIFDGPDKSPPANTRHTPETILAEKFFQQRPGSSSK